MNSLKRDIIKGIFFSMLSGTLAGTFSIPILFYTYTGILGFHTLILDLLTFVLSVSAGFYMTYQAAGSCPSRKKSFRLLIAVIILTVCFIVFTYAPPSLGIFEAPE